MAVLPTGIGPVTGGYQIERSLRFNSADSAYLSRTFGTPTSNKKWTWSGWVKRSSLSTDESVFGSGSAASTFVNGFDSATNTWITRIAGTTVFQTAAVYRDVSAFYHVVYVFDSDNATQADRIILYINGVRQTTTTASVSSGATTSFNSNGAVSYIGRNYGWNATSADYYDGYMTEVNFIDGQALTPSDFGETDSATGVWKPKAYSGTYGTNGFYLKFADNSGTTSTTLGKDSSGNGNNWTPNNFSVTAGTGNDSLVDTPTQYGTDTGAGGEVRGNYCTLNPNDNGNSNILLTNGNLSVSSSTTWDRGVKGTFGVASGKWYYEYTHGTVNAGTNPAADIGWTKYPSLVNSASNGGASSSDSYFCQGSNGNKYNAGSGSSYGSAFATGDVEMCAIDLDNGKVYWGKNGTWFSSGDPAAGTNAAYTGLSGTFFPLWYWGISAGTSGVLISNINFGQRPFAYTAPSGFKALCTTNLPTPTIGATSTTQAGKYFNTVLWTGNTSTAGVTQAITGVGFQPGFLWAKTRNQAFGHYIYDAIRGVGSSGKRLNSAATTAEATNGEVDTFDSDGFTVKYTDTNTLNWSSSNNVGWAWKANGAGSSNTAGTITSTVSANTTSGFSIATFTQPSSSPYTGTVGHGLGVAPSMVIIKDRSMANGWLVYHASLGATQYLVLSSTAAAATGSNAFNNTAPTSSVFTTAAGSTYWGNAGATAVAYCFAPVASYSSFGSYVGNGSSDGPFVFCGFRPRYVMTKRTDSTSNWTIQDTARDTYNATNAALFANLSLADNTGPWFDILSNGFKVRNNGSDTNASGGTYIYAAFAETPAKFSLAR